MKDIQITTEEYLMALQKEYFSATIREIIYPHQNDKEYFYKLCEKKKEKIEKVCRRYKLKGIFDSVHEYERVRSLVYNYGGYPNFIYNILNVEEKQLRFCYAGSAVKIWTDCGNGFNYIYGTVDRVNFKTKTVLIDTSSDKQEFQLSEVKRMSHEETDRYFWNLNGHLVK